MPPLAEAAKGLDPHPVPKRVVLGEAGARGVEDHLRPSGPPMNGSILVVFGGAMGAAVYLLPAIADIALALIVAASAVYATAIQPGFNRADVWSPLALPLLVPLPLALLGLLGQYLLEQWQQQLATRAIGYYPPGALPRHSLSRLSVR